MRKLLSCAVALLAIAACSPDVHPAPTTAPNQGALPVVLIKTLPASQTEHTLSMPLGVDPTFGIKCEDPDATLIRYADETEQWWECERSKQGRK